MLGSIPPSGYFVVGKGPAEDVEYLVSITHQDDTNKVFEEFTPDCFGIRGERSPILMVKDSVSTDVEGEVISKTFSNPTGFLMVTSSLLS